MRRLLIFLPLFFALSVHGEDWASLQFLIGNWTTDQASSGERAGGTGSFSFTPDLQGRVLVRKSFAEYPAQPGKAAYRHDDLMIIYRQGDSGPLRAMFFDNEGHTIAYSVTTSEGKAVFLSEDSPGPHFRLTYSRSDPDHVKLKFEIAPPGKEFSTYIEAGVHREK